MEKKKRVLRNNPEKLKCNYRKKLSAKAKEMMKRQDKILYISKKNHITCCTLVNNNCEFIDENLKDIYPWLNEANFDYPHVSNIINYKHIEDVERKMEGLEVKMKDKSCLKVAKVNKVQFIFDFVFYLNKNGLPIPKGLQKGNVNNS